LMGLHSSGRQPQRIPQKQSSVPGRLSSVPVGFGMGTSVSRLLLDSSEQTIGEPPRARL
jgi:hypothetical protein